VRRFISPTLWLIVAGVVLVACSSTGSTTLPAAPNAIPTPVIAQFTVATGDAGDGGPVNTGGYTWDISAIAASRIGPPGGTYTEIVISTAFENPDGVPDGNAGPSLPPAGGTDCVISASNAVLCGQLYIDTDGNAATGVNIGICGVNGSYPGTDYIVDVGANAPLNGTGQAPIFSNAGGIFEGMQVGYANVTVTQGGSAVNVFVPISLIGGSANGPFNVGVSWGTAGFANDCAADTFIPDFLGGNGPATRSFSHPY